MADRTTSPLVIELTPDQIQLVRAALGLLLASEEDRDEIRQIKALLARLTEDAR